ncbi:MAG: hypothetical protein Q8R02_14240 [Hyphomonadaceae bacterium]|nr:hypothetical protein [Hyphomonadaceae bacterium]
MNTPATKPDETWFKSTNLPKLAFAIALSAPVAGALVALILGVTVLGATIFNGGLAETLVNIVNAAFGGLMLGAIIGWPVMLVFFVPLHAFLLRKTSGKAWIYAIAGAVAGAAAGALRFVSSGGAATINDLTLFLAIGSTTGVLSAIIFWLVRRPDKDAASFKA